jgi:hypothetical protein
MGCSCVLGNKKRQIEELHDGWFFGFCGGGKVQQVYVIRGNILFGKMIFMVLN